MLYYLHQLLHVHSIHIPGLGLFRFISFRTGLAFLLALLIGLLYGKKIIIYLRNKQMGEQIRELGLKGQKEKEGTPTMGGIIIIIGTLIPVLLFAQITNIYIILLLVTMLWMGGIGWIDDYLKKYKKNKDGLSGKFKILGQVVLGVFVGSVMFFHPDITIRSKLAKQQNAKVEVTEKFTPAHQDAISTIPFTKNNEFDYSKIIFWKSDVEAKSLAWLIFIPIVVFIVTAVSNGANLTDGIDGLAAGSSVIILLTLVFFAYLSGNIIFADYLNIMFLPNMGEVSVFTGAMMGALIGFFWYNTYPAQVFMGDTGSLMLGGVIAVLAIILRKELLIPVLCGIFLVENLSVVLQVSYFKFLLKTKGRTYAEANRLFLMSPLHHHYQKKGWHESKIVNRFLIVGLMLAVICLITLKIR